MKNHFVWLSMKLQVDITYESKLKGRDIVKLASWKYSKPMLYRLRPWIDMQQRHRMRNHWLSTPTYLPYFVPTCQTIISLLLGAWLKVVLKTSSVIETHTGSCQVIMRAKTDLCLARRWPYRCSLNYPITNLSKWLAPGYWTRLLCNHPPQLLQVASAQTLHIRWPHQSNIQSWSNTWTWYMG